MYFKNKQEGKNTGQGLNCTEPKLHEGTKMHGDNFAQNNTNLKYLNKNVKECLFTIKKNCIKNRLV